MKRRTLLKAGLAGSLASLWPVRPLLAADAAPATLKATTRTIEVNGKAATVFGLIGPDGRPGLVLDREQGFRVELTNSLSEETLIHWHGLTPPWDQDGVPDVPKPMLKSGESRLYDFALASAGTNWMHAHTLQEQNLLAAPLIIRSAEDRKRDEQEVVLFLHDFSFTPPEELLAKLSSGMGHGSTGHGTMAQGGMDHGAMDHGTMDHSSMNHGDMSAMQSMEEQMAMPMDLNDIEYDAYLANDRTLDDPEIIGVEKGGQVRLRIINAATSTAFTIDLGTLEGQLIAVDGQPVQPRTVRQVPLTMAQRADIRLAIPPAGGSFPILALREGTGHRTGLILATPGAAITRLPVQDESVRGPVLDLSFEAGLLAAEPLAGKEPARSYEVGLVGNMMTYRWGLEGADRLVAAKGDRIEVTLVNRSMMAHPMHLHGHHFQVVAINGQRFSGAVRDTLLLPPMQSATIAFDAGNPGKWAFHCHHLYHMVSGMMAFVTYEGY
ncbi:multicopper oxidase family protein [Gellertiella hungarica]|uniref:FtsP/CotA-like multicopper oxidase with cupredoxin domain n=1 Tax=Gellertiella hungarica TaxID=1572859 RepID=A0A7W6NLC3_9HYPH|nr:multicopper oxidase family protein [Gellertiella hungarica]MBB4065275.1 FtsP/CotA-like multicopper oxidase with cupredoxin domain [Gellertiella hungarica]